MRRLTLVLAYCGLLTSLCPLVSAAEELIVPYKSNVDVGKGWDIRENVASAGKACVEVTPPSSSNVSPIVETRFRMVKVQSFRESARELGLSLSARYATASGSLQHQELDRSSYSSIAVRITAVQSTEESRGTAELNQSGRDALRDAKATGTFNYRSFVNSCGTHYIFARVLGWKIFGSMKVEERDRATTQSTAAVFNQTTGATSITAELQSKINRVASSQKSQLTLNITTPGGAFKLDLAEHQQQQRAAADACKKKADRARREGKASLQCIYPDVDIFKLVAEEIKDPDHQKGVIAVVVRPYTDLPEISRLQQNTSTTRLEDLVNYGLDLTQLLQDAADVYGQKQDYLWLKSVPASDLEAKAQIAESQTELLQSQIGLNSASAAFHKDLGKCLDARDFDCPAITNAHLTKVMEKEFMLRQNLPIRISYLSSSINEESLTQEIARLRIKIRKSKSPSNRTSLKQLMERRRRDLEAIRTSPNRLAADIAESNQERQSYWIHRIVSDRCRLPNIIECQTLPAFVKPIQPASIDREGAAEERAEISAEGDSGAVGGVPGT